MSEEHPTAQEEILSDYITISVTLVGLTPVIYGLGLTVLSLKQVYPEFLADSIHLAELAEIFFITILVLSVSLKENVLGRYAGRARESLFVLFIVGMICLFLSLFLLTGIVKIVLSSF